MNKQEATQDPAALADLGRAYTVAHERLHNISEVAQVLQIGHDMEELIKSEKFSEVLNGMTDSGSIGESDGVCQGVLG